MTELQLSDFPIEFWLLVGLGVFAFILVIILAGCRIYFAGFHAGIDQVHHFLTEKERITLTYQGKIFIFRRELCAEPVPGSIHKIGVSIGD